MISIQYNQYGGLEYRFGSYPYRIVDNELSSFTHNEGKLHHSQTILLERGNQRIRLDVDTGGQVMLQVIW